MSENKISQKELAAKTGLSASGVSNILSSNRSLLTPNAAKTLDALNLTLEVIPKKPKTGSDV